MAFTNDPLNSVVTITLNPAIDQTLTIPGFAAGAVNRVAESRSDAGGKGINVASILADLGVSVTVSGFLGQDNAALFDQLFARKRIMDHFVRLAGSTRVGIKIVDPRGAQTTDINFPGLTPTSNQVEQLFARIDSLAGAARWFVLSGSVPAGVDADIYAQLIDAVHEKGNQVVLDTSGAPLREALESAPQIVKPNVSELSELVGRPLESTDAVKAAAVSLLKSRVRLVVVSMGAAGAIFVERGRAVLARPPRVLVKSTVGAGDAMVCGLVYAQIKQLPIAETARFATAMGAHAVTSAGTGVERASDYEQYLADVKLELLE